MGAGESTFTHEELIQLATLATPHQSYVSPGDGVYLAPGNMVERIRQQCSLTGQTVPETTGAIVRCILESLALEFRQTLDELQLITGTRPRVIHMVGGGVHNPLLCQFTANAAGVPVVAGPAEATSAGNCMLQFLAHGEVSSLAEIREVMAASFSPRPMNLRIQSCGRKLMKTTKVSIKSKDNEQILCNEH